MAHRSRARRVNRQKDQVWSVSLFADSDVAAGATVVMASIVDDSDWQAASISAQRATLLRIRGWFSMRQQTTVGVGSPGGVFMYATVVDEDATVAVADSANTYADEDILWTGGMQLPSLGDATARSYTKDFVLDIKSMRKIRTGQRVELIVTNDTTDVVEFSGVIRGLVRIGGN